MVDLLNISLIRCFLLQTLGHYLCSMLIAFSTAGPRTFLWIFEAIFETKYEQYLWGNSSVRLLEGVVYNWRWRAFKSGGQ